MTNPNKNFLEEVQQTAEKELAQEFFEEEVKKAKAKLKAHVPFWHRVFPFVITRRKK